jgi:hypothetical protein
MKRHFSLPLIIACALFAGTTLSAQDGSLVSWNFSTNINVTSWDATLLASAPAISYSGYASKYNPDGARSGGFNNANGNLYARVGNMGNTLATASKFYFTLVPATSMSLDLGQLTFDIGFQNSGTADHPAYTLNYQVGVKIGAENETILSNKATLNAPAKGEDGIPSGPVDIPAIFDLSAYKGMTSSVTLTIYIYATDVGGALTTDQTARIDNIVVSPSSIPEPSGLALFIGFTAGLVVFSRRRSRQ